jgi:chromosome segregation ATPase
MRHDSTREVEAAVRDATASVRRERDDAWKKLNVKDDTIAKQSATITELRAEVAHLEKVRETLEMAIVKLGDERGAANASLAELHAHIDRNRKRIHELFTERDVAVAECIELRETLSQANASLAEMTSCRTAGQLQEARERQQRRMFGGMCPLCGTGHTGACEGMYGLLSHAGCQWPKCQKASSATSCLCRNGSAMFKAPVSGGGTATTYVSTGASRPTYQRTDEDGPMWRPGDLAT